MSALTALRSAWCALAANLLRSLLTMLGIIIGVAAVITMVAVGSGAQKRVESQIKALGSNILLVLPGSQNAAGVRGGAQSAQSLTELDAAAIAAEVDEVQAVAPSSRTNSQVVYGNTNWNTLILGTTPQYHEVRDWPVLSGRPFEAAEIQGSAKVVMVGLTVAQKLFGEVDPLGQVIRVRQVPLTVIGVLGPKGQNALGQDQDDVLMVPISTFRNRIVGSPYGRLKRVGVISVKVAAGQSMQLAREDIQALLRQRRRVLPGQEDDFSVQNLSEMLQAQEAASRVMTSLLAAVAGVSLIVGGIGIMNIMLVSVTERTREIGLRMAVGARSRDILGQFLIEATLLSFLGGALGVVLGACATWAVAWWADWPVSLSFNAVVLAVGFSAAVGVFFGYYPARRAARLLPIQALRFE